MAEMAAQAEMVGAGPPPAEAAAAPEEAGVREGTVVALATAAETQAQGAVAAITGPRKAVATNRK